jgi:hypothetical protein
VLSWSGFRARAGLSPILQGAGLFSFQGLGGSGLT